MKEGCTVGSKGAPKVGVVMGTLVGFCDIVGLIEILLNGILVGLGVGGKVGISVGPVGCTIGETVG